MKSQEFHLIRYPEGKPATEDFRLCTKELPKPAKGQLLVKNLWLSVDPYMRGRMTANTGHHSAPGRLPAFALNEPLEGAAIGQVIESNNPTFSPGDLVTSIYGWRDAFVSDGLGLHKLPASQLPIQSFLGIAGLPGLTAWAGLHWVGGIKPGNTVLVSAASGAVGSMVCQLAKLNDCKVIATAGSEQKIDWLENVLRVDKAINYKKTINLSAALCEVCDDGIDVCFENVGGDHLQTAISLMKNNGRIVLCGMLSQYNSERSAPGPDNLNQIISKSLRMEGFVATDYWHMYPKFLVELNQWHARGELQWQETIVEGLENTPRAFIDLFDGKNIGKMLVKL